MPRAIGETERDLFAALSAGAKTLRELGSVLSVTSERVSLVMRSRPDLFARVGVSHQPHSGYPPRLWGLVPGATYAEAKREGPICRHCGKRPRSRPRGLCWGCYHRPGVKELYAPTNIYALRREPTEAELERMIAEQMKCLPSWWDADTRRMRREQGDGSNLPRLNLTTGEDRA